MSSFFYMRKCSEIHEALNFRFLRKNCTFALQPGISFRFYSY
jgi:hypothetical protein